MTTIFRLSSEPSMDKMPQPLVFKSQLSYTTLAASVSWASRLVPQKPTCQLKLPGQSESGDRLVIFVFFTSTSLCPPTCLAQRVTPDMVKSQSSTVTLASSTTVTAQPTPRKSLSPKPSKSAFTPLTVYSPPPDTIMPLKPSSVLAI